MLPLASALGTIGTVTLGLLGVEAVTSNGPDYVGISLLVTAISSFVATVGSIVIVIVRRPDAEERRLLRKLAEQAGLDPDEVEQL